MQGFASELLGEIFTKGKGPFGQIGIPLGQPLNSEYAGVALAVWVSRHCYLVGAPFVLPLCILFVSCECLHQDKGLLPASSFVCPYMCISTTSLHQYDALACRWAFSSSQPLASETLASRRATTRSTEQMPLYCGWAGTWLKL